MTAPMNNDISNYLQQNLRDIHLPEPIGWWPLAHGWWLLLALVGLLLIAAYIVRVIQQRRKADYRKRALQELQTQFNDWQSHQNDSEYLNHANQVLRRCLLHLPSATLAVSNSGGQWVDTLNLYGHQPLSQASADAVGEQCYRPQPKVDVHALHRELEVWIRKHHTKPNPSLSSSTDVEALNV